VGEEKHESVAVSFSSYFEKRKAWLPEAGNRLYWTRGPAMIIRRGEFGGGGGGTTNPAEKFRTKKNSKLAWYSLLGGGVTPNKDAVLESGQKTSWGRKSLSHQ